MSVTSIQFIGLFVVIMNSGAGLHILLPHFPGTPFADHVSAIQFNPDQVSSASWSGIVACGPNNSLRCAPIDLETITFTGAIDPPPADIVGAIPHLRCCCASMTDIRQKYKDPNATDKLSAHIFIERGVVEAIAAPNGRVDTWVTMHSTDPVGITVTGTTGGVPVNIVFKPGAQFVIMNSLAQGPDTPSHFLAYYLMGIGSSQCTAVPTDGPPCEARSTECVIPKKLSAKPAVRRPAKTRHPGRVPVSVMDVNSDCSNSHWP